MKNRLGGLVTILIATSLAPLLSACSSSSGSCGKVQPCGGDIVGDYKISSVCVNNGTIAMQIQQYLPNCPQLTANVSSFQVTGTESFNADLTYNADEMVTAAGQAMVPPSCLQSGGITLTCGELDLLLQQLIATSPGQLQSAHCTGSTTCVCGFVLAPMHLVQMGTYTTSGTNITLTASDGTYAANQYCVKGNELHLVTVNATMPIGSMGQVNIDSDTVETRR